MRFAVSFELKTKEWVVVATDGEFTGQVVASAEGLLLRDVAFRDDVMFGSISAAWGITLKDEVTTSLGILKALGIGRPFKGGGTRPMTLDGTNFICAESGRNMIEATHVLLMKQGMFYSKERSFR